MANPAFRDVTIFHAEDAHGWIKYLLQHFHTGALSLRVDSMDLTHFDYNNPPEVAVAIQESYVIVLFITGAMLDYMEQKAGWFAAMLDQRDTVVTSIIGVYLNADQDDIESVCAKHNYTGDAWELVELLGDGSNMCHVVTKVLDSRDNNLEKGLRRQSINRRKEITNPYWGAEIVPSAFSTPGERAMIIFPEEVEGTITLEFSGLSETVQATLINPYNATFFTPELTRDNMIITVQIDDKTKYTLKWTFKDILSAFTSVEFLRETTGAESIRELDEKLATKYKCTLNTVSYSNQVLDYLGDSSTASSKGQGLYPTLLHLSAAFGLNELVCALLSSPGAAVACSIENSEGALPADLARENGHSVLADFMLSYQETKMCVDVCAKVYESQIDLPTFRDFVHEKSSLDSPKVGRPVPAERQNIKQPKTTDDSSLRAPPPIPPRKKSTCETHDEDYYVEIDSQDCYVTPDIELVGGAMGSRGQAELIAIQDEVKRGNFNVEEAERLFSAWKDRYKMGNTASFKTKQEGLLKLQAEFPNTIQTIKNARQKNEPKKKGKLSSSSIGSGGKDNESGSTVSHLAVLIGGALAGSQTKKSSRSLVPGQRVSNTSISSTTSYDSGRDSNISQLSLSSEGGDLEPDQLDSVLRKKPSTGSQLSSSTNLPKMEISLPRPKSVPPGLMSQSLYPFRHHSVTNAEDPLYSDVPIIPWSVLRKKEGIQRYVSSSFTKRFVKEKD
ncbi:phosphoinositide 3-kinase adapter protein 1 [Aplysia californica]|uniref:Phosphoinositide 3-kinase adapter protein 1 n=1 Tax=Aplysia californica TaxID=6500 RepID=A0ABM0JMR2_APLCA|nr:phosphoinositide 3-kinase adapter protein 1 [Aplysia californica]